jgi:hypothetical protein
MSTNDRMMAKEGENMNGQMIWAIIAAVIALIGGIVLYFTFLKSKNEGKFKGFLGWLYDFLTFRKMMLEALLRICYLILVIYVTLIGFAAGNILVCLLTILIGNLAIRFVYEFALILLVICRNTSEISRKLNVKEVKEEKVVETTIAE